MSAPKFTSGWKVVDGYFPCFRELVGPSFKVSVVMQATDLTFADAIQREDELQLMSAAPELYEALEGALDLLASYPGFASEAAWLKAHAALAKARGEA